MDADQAWNSCSIELCRATRLHVKAYLIKNYFGYVRKFQGSNATHQVLLDLGKLYALDQITHAQHLFSKVIFKWVEL